MGRDWIHANFCVPLSLHQQLILWHLDAKENEDKVKVVMANNRLFMLNTNMATAILYQDDVGLLKFVGQDKYRNPIRITIMNFVDIG